MLLCPWNKLPEKICNEAVRPYYEILHKKKAQLLVKRIFDLLVSSLMVIFLLPLLLVIAIAIKLDSKGPVFFRQTRVTANYKEFKIFKFRTMCEDAESLGTQITTHNDTRVTKVGQFLRKYRIDEIPQLFNIISGDMTFVGTRPEVVKYVKQYTPEMYATLLLPAGVTSECSIRFKDEERLLENSKNVDDTYINDILPNKMQWNLRYFRKFSLTDDFKIMIMTIFAVCGKSLVKD